MPTLQQVDARQRLIAEIERIRQSKVITYITSDRPNASSQIAMEVVPRFFRHLEAIGRTNRIDLFLYTRGGDTLTPIRLVNLIREYCDELNVLVPFRCHSSGTLVCLGADAIVMGKLGELGPVDPRVVNDFNPADPNAQGGKLFISVEDVAAFIQLAKEKVSISDDQMHSVMQVLTQHVHPLALGNVQRHHALIRTMAWKLLTLRNGKTDHNEPRLKHIIDALTEKISSHDYPINRREAKYDIGLEVQFPPADAEKAIWDLYLAYAADMSLSTPFSITKVMNPTTRQWSVDTSFIESATSSDAYVIAGGVDQQNNVVVDQDSWLEVK